jgi:hypothetical protein
MRSVTTCIFAKNNYNDQAKEDEMGAHVDYIGEKKNSYMNLVRNPGEKKPLGRPRRTSEDHIKMDLREIGWGGIVWDNLPQDMEQRTTPLNTVMNFRISQYCNGFVQAAPL